MSVRYVAATDGWRKWFRWLRILFRPYLADYYTLNDAWARLRGLNRNLPPELWRIDAQHQARKFEERNWNAARRRAWETRVRDYPHGIAESYIGGPLVIP